MVFLKKLGLAFALLRIVSTLQAGEERERDPLNDVTMHDETHLNPEKSKGRWCSVFVDDFSGFDKQIDLSLELIMNPQRDSPRAKRFMIIPEKPSLIGKIWVVFHYLDSEKSSKNCVLMGSCSDYVKETSFVGLIFISENDACFRSKRMLHSMMVDSGIIPQVMVKEEMGIAFAKGTSYFLPGHNPNQVTYWNMISNEFVLLEISSSHGSCFSFKKIERLC